jgi:hypothetical protein
MAQTKQQILDKYKPKVEPTAPVESQRARTAAQGLTFGFADEVEAFIRSGFSDRQYDEIRDELRAKLTAYKKANQGEALTYELAGALVPSIALSMTGFGAPAGGANLMRTGKVLLGESAASAIGYSEGDLSASQSQLEALGNTAQGVGFGAVVEGGVRLTGPIFGKVINFVRKKFGDKADNAVQAELLRLVEETGKSVDEVIADVAEGRIMADNMTLVNSIKAMVNEGGLTKAEILASSAGRAASTRTAAQEELKGALAPQFQDPNVIRAMKQSDEQIKAQERKGYQEVFEGGAAVPASLQEQMLSVIQRMPQAADELVSIYRARNIVPLFKKADDGSIEFVRTPSLEDAEILRRTLKDISKGQFDAGRGTMGAIVSDLEKSLKTPIDAASPELASVRQQFATNSTARNAFNLARNKALTMNVDELSYIIEQMAPEALEAFRAGALDALNNQARKSGVMLRDLANEDKQIGAALRVILPPQQADSVLGAVGRAAEATQVAQRVRPEFGSPTQALQRQQEKMGSRVSAEDALRGSQGDMFSLIRILRDTIPSGKGLSDEQMLQVVKVLFSEDPTLVETALKDKRALGELLRKAEAAVSTLATGARTGAVQQAAQPAGQ